MPEVAKLWASVGLDDQTFRRGMQNVGKNLAQARTDLQNTGKRFEVLERLSQAAGSGVARAFSGIGASARALSSPFSTAGKAFDGLASRATAFNEKVDQTRHKFQQIGQAAHTLTGPLNVAGNALSKFGGLAGNALAGLGAVSLGGLAAATAALKALADRGVDMNLTVNGAEAAFGRIARSAPLAAKFISDLRKEAETAAPTFKEMLGTAQSLAAVYIEKYGPSGLGRVIPTMRAFADAATVLRVGSGGIDLALGGFRQVAASPKPMLEDIKQVDEALPGAGIRSIVRAAFGSDESDVLAKAGKTGRDVAEAIVAGLQAKFNGAQAAGANTLPIILSNIQDTLDNIGASATKGLTAMLTRAGKSVLDTLGMINSSGIGKALETIFDTAGKAVEGLAAKLPALVDWLAKIFTADHVKLFFINGIALAKTFGETIAQIFGVDLKAAMDPKNVNGFFSALGVGVTAGINALFGFGRVWNELQAIVKGWVVDSKDLLFDWADDVGRMFKGLFFGLQASIQTFSGAMLKSIVSVLDAYNEVADQLNRNAIFKWLTHGVELPKIATGGLYSAQLGAMAEAAVSSGQVGQQAIDQQHAEQERATREQRKDKADPFRHDSFGKRIGDAFAGTNRDTSAQTGFWERFDTNRLDVAKFLYQGTGTPPATPAGSQIPMPFLGRQPGQAVQDPRVRDYRDPIRHPEIPQFAPPSLPQYGGAPGYDPNDPYRPVTLPDGRTTTAYLAPYLPPSAAGAQGQVMDDGTGGGSGSAQVVNNVLNISLDGQELTEDDFRRFYRLYQQARQQEQTQVGRAAPSTGFVR